VTGIPDVIGQRYDPCIPLGQLTEHPANPNDGDAGAVCESLDAHGFYGAVLVQEATGIVFAGNTRLRSARSKGMAGIPGFWCDVDDDTRDRILSVDNQSNRVGRNDEAKLVALLTGLAQQPRGLEGTGFDGDDLDALIAALGGQGRGGSGDPDDVPEPPVEPITRPGDVWLLGTDHRLLCADATDPTAYERLLGDEAADLLVTDPPYGVSYAAKNRFLNALAKGNAVQEPILGDHEKPEDMSRLWNAAFGAARKVMAPGAPYYVTGPQGGDLLLLLLSLKDSGFPLRHMLIWAKNNHVLGRSDYNYKHEPIIYGWVEGSHHFHGGGGETSLWEIPKPLKSDLHPTMKPVELFARAVRNSSERDDVVLDLFAGSGTTVIACHQEGRRARVLELDVHYSDVICKRFETYSGIKPERVLPDGTTEPVTFLGEP